MDATAHEGISAVEERLLRLEEIRYRQRVTEIKKVAGTLRQLAAGPSGGQFEVATAILKSNELRSLYSPIQIVRQAAKGFARTPFTLDDLCARINAEHPGVLTDRGTVSRRLFQLREGKGALIESVPAPKTDRDPIYPLKKKQRLYRYIGPP